MKTIWKNFGLHRSIIRHNNSTEPEQPIDSVILITQDNEPIVDHDNNNILAR